MMTSRSSRWITGLVALVAILQLVASCRGIAGYDPARDVALPDGAGDGAISEAAVDANNDAANDAAHDVANADAVNDGDAHPPDLGGVAPGSWVALGAGTFMMGTPLMEACWDGSEDHHQVTLTRGFELQETEVTQDQFSALMGYKTASSCQPDSGTCPVQNVTWHEAAAYCNWLSSILGLERCYQCSGADSAVVCGVESIFAGQAIVRGRPPKGR